MHTTFQFIIICIICVFDVYSVGTFLHGASCIGEMHTLGSGGDFRTWSYESSLSFHPLQLREDHGILRFVIPTIFLVRIGIRMNVQRGAIVHRDAHFHRLHRF